MAIETTVAYNPATEVFTVTVVSEPSDAFTYAMWKMSDSNLTVVDPYQNTLPPSQDLHLVEDYLNTVIAVELDSN